MSAENKPDEDVDFLDLLIAKAAQDIADGTVDEASLKEFENHPLFSSSEESKDHPVTHALESLALEEENPDWEALDKKREGNFFFKCKKYRSAAKEYTEGIKQKSPNKETNAQLLSNRAAAHFHLGNYGTAVRDCALACKLKPDYTKATIRGIQSCLELKRGDDALKWCDRALLREPDNEPLLELRKKASIVKSTSERDARKEKLQSRKEEEIEKKLVLAIHERKLRIAGAEGKRLRLKHLETQHPTGAHVFLSEDNSLYWPLVFVYPEFRQTDSISAFNENSRFQDHLDIILGDSNPPATWDPHRRYRPDNIELYFEDRDEVKLWRIKPTSTLRSVLSAGKYVIFDGTVSFFVVIKDSPFAGEFLSKYK